MKRPLLVGCVGALLVLWTTGRIHLPLDIGAPAEAQTGAPPLGADPLASLSDRFEAVAAKVSPAVVAIEAVKPPKTGPGGKGKPVEESGSGVIIKVEGRAGYFIITNNHVVSLSKPEQITVQLEDGRVFRPKQVLSDVETDIALLHIEASGTLPTAVLGNSDQAKVGRWVLAIGNPFGLNQSVSHGIISARDRGQVSLGSAIRIKEFLQTDAAINPGSSGGPLVDMNGHVVGINTAIASNNGSSSGVAFSIPINLVRRVATQMLTTGSVQRGYLGMQVASTMDPAEALRLGLDRVQGALVEQVFPDTPAAGAGLAVKDVILQIDSVTIRSENHLINLVSGLPPGQRVRLQVWRDRRVVTLDAVVGDWSKATTRLAGS
ncbi:MAG: trypsin-like peptidase domain-containing protein [Gemmataceae bacterium]